MQDLLPQYVENLLLPESEREVAEHLKECEACREIYRQMNCPEPIPIEAVREVDYLKKVKHDRMTFERRFLAQTADCLWSLGFTDTDHLLLYLSRYGRDFVRDYRLQYKKEQT